MVTATATVYVLADFVELTRVPMKVQDPSAPAVQLWFRSASIALKEVETSPGSDDGGGAGALSVDAAALGPVDVPGLPDSDDDGAGLAL